MSVSPDGLAVITASKDRSIRTWEKTTEPLVLEEEQEIVSFFLYILLINYCYN